ncbi:uncharacterized protein LOC124118977 [Haliotis rufescens]|uniref:uncharacterized protein LOC124118977 n=1 Tax=Haliotis rufescens TaxID=6454 RepID=UPI00201EA9B3|nr:uncharacterized protein LOC124118977 [Haliotis rufescens]
MSWFGYADAADLARAQEVARNEARRVKEEKERAEEARKEANESNIRAKDAEERAQKENQRANEERERAEQEKMAAGKAKEEATESARRAEQAAEQAHIEKQKALEAQGLAKEERVRAEEARARAENEARKSVETRQKKETAEQENKRLLDEKDEKQKRDETLMQFAWGPKKTKRGRWTAQEVQRLRDMFYEHMHDKEGRLIHGKILIFGPSGAGKSSFCNGLRAALKDSAQPTTYYAVGSHDNSLTRTFQPSQYGDHWIIDMPGIFESSDFKTESIEAIASGRVRFDAQIGNWKTLEVKINQQQARRDVSCVVLVLHHGITLGDELKRQLNAIIRLGGEGVLSYHLVLTHLDECDPQFKDPENIPNLYNSPLVQEAVKMMSEQTGIPPYAISYVKNYVTENTTHTNTKLLHLEALDRILTSTAEQVEKMIDLKLQKNMYEDARVSWTTAVFISAAVMCVCAVVYMCTQ